ncbi:MAG: hypothetical protein ACRDTU_17935 [Micromonosporaceae bacterium]
MSRYTLDNPPPAEPPAELRLARGNGLGIWRVMYSQWMDHRPTPKGDRCKEPRCGRRSPCWGLTGAASTLEHLHRYPQGAGLVGYHPLPPVLLPGAPRITRVPVRP